MPARPLFSLIIGTARNSFNSLRAWPMQHYMLHTLQSLTAQTHTDFEVIIVDSLHDRRDLAAELAGLGKWPFPLKVILNDSWWVQTHKLWGLQHAFNQGAVASRGKYLLFCGDCFSLPPRTLTRCWELIQQGRIPHLLCWKRIGGYLKDPKAEPFDEPIVINGTPVPDIEAITALGRYVPGTIYGDSRFDNPMMQANGCILPEHASWQWFYGYGFLSREDFFTLNGWSELYDGDKALGDVELGSRLEQSGRLHFYMEKDLVVYEEIHFPIALDEHHTGIQNTLRSNYDLLWLHRFHNITRAHTTLFTESDLMRVVRGLISGIHCWPYRYDTLPPEIATLTRYWIDHQPIFTLEDYCAGV